MRLYLTVLIGEDAGSATPVVTTMNQELARATLRAMAALSEIEVAATVDGEEILARLRAGANVTPFPWTSLLDSEDADT